MTRTLRVFHREQACDPRYTLEPYSTVRCALKITKLRVVLPFEVSVGYNPRGNNKQQENRKIKTLPFVENGSARTDLLPQV